MVFEEEEARELKEYSERFAEFNYMNLEYPKKRKGKGRNRELYERMRKQIYLISLTTSTNIEDVYQSLVNRTKPSGLTQTFHNMLKVYPSASSSSLVLIHSLQDLLVLPPDTDNGIRNWLTVERIVRQISLQREMVGVDEGILLSRFRFIFYF